MNRPRLRNLLGIAVTLLATAVAFDVAARITPLPAGLEAGVVTSTEFVDRDGRPLRIILAEEKRYSRRCRLDEVSECVLDATVSAEDQRFWRHAGVDPIATARAMGAALGRGHAKSGASTITQQLIKLASPGPRTVSRKLSESWLALCLERRWEKQQILIEYLNRLDYGNLQVGVASASRFYFGKPPSDLSAAEAAFLAALPKAPGRLDPHSNFPGAWARQQWVLRRMHADGRLEAAAYERSKGEPLVLRPPRREFAAPHFVDLLLHRRGVLANAGRLVRTTLDLPLTRRVEHALRDQLARIADKNATAGAVVVIDNATGDVLALAGSGDYLRPGAGQVNGAWMERSPGSALKPFTYLLALESGANPGTVVPDVPTEFPTSTGLYRPNNYNHRFHGPVSLRFALGNSLNVAAIRALELAGGPEVLHRRLRDAGLSTLTHPADYYGLGITLGNAEVRLLELANAFATLGRLGISRPFRLLRGDHDGGGGAGRRLFDAYAAYLVADILADNSARAASFGLNSFLSFDFPVACKTGTSSDYRDNWAVGYTPEFTVAVWVGNPDGTPMRAITGVTGAAPVLHEIFGHLHEERGTSWFTRPDGIEEHPIDPFTGRRVNPGWRGAVLEKCLWPPESARSSDYDAAGAVVLPEEYRAWLASPQNSMGDLVAAAKLAGELRIVQPVAGTVYFLDSDLPPKSQRVRLVSHGSASVQWSSGSLECEPDGKEVRVQLRPGRHAISACDHATGRTASTWIEVREL